MLVQALSILAMILSISGNLILTKRSAATFPIWIAANVLWIIVNFLGTPNYPQIIMYLFYTGTSICSMYNWRRIEKKNKENKDNSNE